MHLGPEFARSDFPYLLDAAIKARMAVHIPAPREYHYYGSPRTAGGNLQPLSYATIDRQAFVSAPGDRPHRLIGLGW